MEAISMSVSEISRVHKLREGMIYKRIHLLGLNPVESNKKPKRYFHEDIWKIINYEAYNQEIQPSQNIIYITETYLIRESKGNYFDVDLLKKEHWET